MKKLISVLMLLMMLMALMTGAMAEGSGNSAETGTETATATESVEADTADGAEEQAKQAEDENAINWAEQPLSVKGLIVTAGGLAGTFLVLILFFGTIKAMQKVLK